MNPAEEPYNARMEDAKQKVLEAAFLLSDAQLRIARLKGQELSAPASAKKVLSSPARSGA